MKQGKRTCNQCVYYKQKHSLVFGEKGKFKHLCTFEGEEEIMPYRAETCQDFKKNAQI